MSSRLAIKCPHLALFVARRNSGKSYLMRHLLHVLARGKKFRWVIVISPTRFNGEWSSIVGDEAVLDTFDPEQVSQLFDRQAELREDGVDNPGLLILDDCLGAANFQSDLFTRIASAGRHYRVSVWVATQHLFKLPPVIRGNSDYLFFLGSQNDRVVKALWEELGGLGFDDWRALKAYVAQAIQNFGALCCDSHDQKSPVKITRAPSRPAEFRISQR